MTKKVKANKTKLKKIIFYLKMKLVDDHSRVKLANKESDYINANYIDVSII